MSDTVESVLRAFVEEVGDWTHNGDWCSRSEECEDAKPDPMYEDVEDDPSTVGKPHCAVHDYLGCPECECGHKRIRALIARAKAVLS